MFTDAQLNAKTKPQLVELAAQLQNSLDAAQAGPLKGSDIEKRLLDLKRQADVVKDNAVKREQEHQKELAKLEAQTTLAKQKLELEYKAEEGSEVINLVKLYKELEDKAAKSMSDLSFGLKQFEIETQAKTDQIAEKLNKATEDYVSQVESYKQKVEIAKENAQDELDEIKLNHTRVLEQTKYDNKIALRDENIKSAETIAATQGKVLIDKTKLSEYESLKATDETVIAERITTAVQQAKSEVYATEGAKYGKLNAESKQEISLLTKDKEYLTQQLKDSNTRVAELTEQIKDFPNQIAKAVEAAKANISVNQDANKK